MPDCLSKTIKVDRVGQITDGADMLEQCINFTVKSIKKNRVDVPICGIQMIYPMKKINKKKIEFVRSAGLRPPIEILASTLLSQYLTYIMRKCVTRAEKPGNSATDASMGKSCPLSQINNRTSDPSTGSTVSAHPVIAVSKIS
jgi:hypothetical protein